MTLTTEELERLAKEGFQVAYIEADRVEAIARELLAARKVVEAARQAYLELANNPHSASSFNAFYALHTSLPAYDQATQTHE